MITKGIIEGIEDHKALVRLPIFDGNDVSKISTKSNNLSKATYCSIANIEMPFAKGDIVFVGFEDNDSSKPIILGHLYKSTKQESTPGLNLSTLNTSSTTKLSASTYIGNIRPNEIACLSGIKSNIQSQIDELRNSKSSGTGDVDLDNIDLSAIESQITQETLRATQKENQLQSSISSHNHDTRYSAINHNHDSDYLKLSGGNLSGTIIFDEAKGITFNTNHNSRYTIYGNGNGGVSDALVTQIVDSNNTAKYYKLIDVNGILYSNNKEVSTIDHNHDSLYAPLNHSHNYLPLTGGTITGNITILGTITQQGSAYETHAEKVYSKNDYIYLREGQTGGLANGDYSGFEFVKYDGTNNGRLVVDNQGIARVGDVGNEQPLATREETPTNGGYAKWNPTTYRFETSSTEDDLVTRKTAQTITGQKTFTQELIKSHVSGYSGYQVKNTGYKLGDTISSQIGLGRFIVYGSDTNYVSYVQTVATPTSNVLQLRSVGSTNNYANLSLFSDHTGTSSYITTSCPIQLQQKVELKYNNSTNSLEFKFL